MFGDGARGNGYRTIGIPNAGANSPQNLCFQVPRSWIYPGNLLEAIFKALLANAVMALEDMTPRSFRHYPNALGILQQCFVKRVGGTGVVALFL